MTLVASDWERNSLEELQGIPKELISFSLSLSRRLSNLLKAMPSSQPLQAVYSWQPQLAQQLTRMIANGTSHIPPFDIIHVEHLRGVKYAMAAKHALRETGGTIPIVWDSVDCISELFRQSAAHGRTLMSRWVTRFELGRTKAYESMMLEKFDRVLVSSESDRKALLKLAADSVPPARICTLPNGVDLEYFQPPANNLRSKNQIILSGKMSYHANVSMVLYFVEQILPIIKHEFPSVEVLIVGKDPVSKIDALQADPAITVTGTVPDLRPYLWQAAVAVAPLPYAVGIQNKVLEAMAAGTPVVMSPTANEGIGLKDGVHALIAATPSEFARSTVSLLKEVELRKKLVKYGRQFVMRNHAWPSIGRALEEIYNELAEIHP